MHHFHAPVGRARNEDALTEKGHRKSRVGGHKGGDGRGRKVAAHKTAQVRGRALSGGQRLGQEKEAQHGQQGADEREDEKVALPGEVRCHPAADHGRQGRPEPEDHRDVGHQHLRFGAAEKVADDGHADHHAAARKKPLTQTPDNEHFKAGGESRAEAAERKTHEPGHHRELAAQDVRNRAVKKRHDGKTGKVRRKRHLHAGEVGAEILRHLMKARQIHVGRKGTDHGAGRQKPREHVGVDGVGIFNGFETQSHSFFLLHQSIGPHFIVDGQNPRQGGRRKGATKVGTGLGARAIK